MNFDDLRTDSTDRTRSQAEEKWVQFQPYLLSKGYRLRARYQPDWKPSWKDGDNPLQFEDSLDCKPIRVLDATRIGDDRQVKIKMVIPTPSGEAKHEYELLQRFSSPPLANDPSNHVVPCLDSFPIPGVDSGFFVVTPLLGRYNRPFFYNLADVHDLLQQLFEGVIFMHKNNVAHCDIAAPNVMLDARPLYNEPFHPFYHEFSLDASREIHPVYTRAQKKSRYYFIDLGHAKWFRDSGATRTAKGIAAREPAPEQLYGGPWDPFAVDVYQLGTLIRASLAKDLGLAFLAPLVERMTQVNPANRPSLETAQAAMNTAFLGLSGWRYRRPIVKKDADFSTRFRALLNGLSAEFKLLLGRILRALRLK
ncbi:hypothetical protein ACGC1H_001067 [Rhizoctonia solani]